MKLFSKATKKLDIQKDLTNIRAPYEAKRQRIMAEYHEWFAKEHRRPEAHISTEVPEDVARANAQIERDAMREVRAYCADTEGELVARALALEPEAIRLNAALEQVLSELATIDLQRRDLARAAGLFFPERFVFVQTDVLEPLRQWLASLRIALTPVQRHTPTPVNALRLPSDETLTADGIH